MTVPLPYLLITLNIIQLQKVYVSSMENLKTVNALTADDKYSLVNRGNLMEPIQILLSHKRNSFSQFFSSFLKSTLNFELFQKKDDPHRGCISEIAVSEKGD